MILARETRYANDIAANIFCALREVGAQPYETAYVSSDPFAIEEAMGTRVGTILVAEGVADAIPDIIFHPGDDAREGFGELASGKHRGLLTELFTTRYGDTTGAGGFGFLFKQKLLQNRRELDPDVTRNLEVIVAGRYFPRKDARHVKHQLSKRLLLLKSGDRRGRPVVESLASTLRLTLENEKIDMITRVPPKPSKPSDYLGDALVAAARLAKARCPTAIDLIDLAAVRCVREYLPQKLAGGWGSRVDNVRGAFVAEPDRVAGKRVLLVDDVLTSGATVVEIARTLLSAGASDVIVCPLAIDQVSINYDEEDELPCPEAGCNGKLQIRFKTNGDAAFWGCTNWARDGSGCNKMMNFLPGWQAANERNARENIDLYVNDPF